MQLSRYQYWVLDHVFELPQYLSDLTIFLKEGESRMGEDAPPIISAVPLLELTVSELAEIILPLFEIGYISLDGCHAGYVPRYGEILVTLHGRGEIGEYKLTDLGGKVWEDYSKPNWDYFVYERAYDHSKGFALKRIICTSRETLERWIVAHQIEPSHEIALICRTWDRIVPGTAISWKTVGKWQPTYWKTLDQGFQAAFQIIPPGGPVFYVEDNVMTEEELTRYLFPLYLEQNWCYKYFDIANPSR
jgi:hypothetical protein